MNLYQILSDLYTITDHGKNFVSEAEFKKKFDKNDYQKANFRKKIRDFLIKNGLIIIRKTNQVLELNLSFLAYDLFVQGNSPLNDILQIDSNFKEPYMIPNLSLILKERGHFPSLDYFFLNTNQIDIWATTAQNFLSYIKGVISKTNQNVSYSNQKFRILIFDAQSFFLLIGAKKEKEIPEAYEFIKCANLNLSDLSRDIFQTSADKIYGLKAEIVKQGIASNFEFRKTRNIRFYSTLIARNNEEIRLQIELYSKFIEGNSRIKLQLYQNKNYSPHATEIASLENEFEECWKTATAF